MPYTALPDRRMPYDNDGTVVYYLTNGAADFQGGAGSNLSGSTLQQLNGQSLSTIGILGGGDNTRAHVYWFFPEQREVTAIMLQFGMNSGADWVPVAQASNDSTNGMDGTWESGSWGASHPTNQNALGSTPRPDYFRAGICPVSFTGTKKALRLMWGGSGGQTNMWTYSCHVYGEKGSGQTPDDIIYINHDDTPGVEYTADEDFGDQPLGTTVVRQFRVKNTSATKTANTINIQCNDSDFAISTDGVVWVVTINIASLSAGAQSATMYIRCTTPAAGSTLGPRFARIITTVASYT